MKKIRISVIGLTLSVLALAPTVPAYGQVVAATFDATQAANMLRQFVEDKLMHSETLMQLGEQLAEAQKLYQFMDAAYKFTTEFIDDSQVIKDAYQSYRYIQSDINALKYQYQYYANGGKITPRRLYYTATVVDRVAGDAYDEFRFLREQVMSDKYKDLSHKDRLDLFAQSSRKFRRYHTLLGQVIADNYNAMKAAEVNEKAQEDVDAAMGTGGAGTGKQDGAYDGDVDKIVVELQQGQNGDVIDGQTLEELEKAYRDKNLASSVIKLVSYIILVIALLLIPINYMRSRSGEMQTEDAFFKVFAGLFIAGMLLQVLSIVLFNQEVTL